MPVDANQKPDVNYEIGVVVEFYGRLREVYGDGRMREARAEITAEFPAGSEDWKLECGEFLDLSNIRCKVHWLGKAPGTASKGRLEKRTLQLEWWHVLSRNCLRTLP